MIPKDGCNFLVNFIS